MSQKPPPRILTIAGSDSSGGAGIQADLKTIIMLGGYGMSAITAITAQNTRGVQGVTPLTGDFVAEQIESCLSDIGADAIKIGMLHDAGIIGEVANLLATLPEAKDVPIILDPVMVATSGGRLLQEDAVEIMREKLFPLATLITPNLPELAILAGHELGDSDAIIKASVALAEGNDAWVLAKGGHTEDARVIDFLVSAEGFHMQFDDPRIPTKHTHGTGCTLSAAIATLVGHGQPLHHAIRLARQFTRAAIENAPGFGDGSGPLGHQAVRKLEG
jgi:hydroxymethylpyrimidine/phosphomethylpyrimidine kinase